jgi:hypothetical protein
VSGAAKLNVRSQLCEPNGTVVMDQVVEGNVRFLGGTCAPLTTWTITSQLSSKSRDFQMQQRRLEKARQFGFAISASAKMAHDQSAAL